MYDELVQRLRSEAVYLPEKFSKNAELLDVLMKAADALKELSKPKWISVTKRLPEDRHDVLVYAGMLFPYITVGYYDGLWKFSYNDEEIAGGADYWMPLPKPPKEE